MLEKPVKHLGRCDDAAFSYTEQIQGLKQQQLESIEMSGFTHKLKLWCLHFGLLPRLLWLLTMYDVSNSKVEELNRMFSIETDWLTHYPFHQFNKGV